MYKYRKQRVIGCLLCIQFVMFKIVCVRNIVVLLMLLFFSLNLTAQISATSKDSFPEYGSEGKSSGFFRNKYLHNDLVHYLDNVNDFVTYESETTGSFNIPDNLIFSVSGNSYRWNTYYLDGFRTDSRFFVGSSLYQPEMFTHSLSLNYYHSELSFSTDSLINNSISIRFNTGGLGGISPLTKELINLFHKSASERLYHPAGQLYSPVDYRAQLKPAGTIALNYTIKAGGKNLRQQFSADFGRRMLLNFNQSGISDYYPENFSRIQLNGDLPFGTGKLFDNTHYILNILNRDHLYYEFYYGKDETARQHSLSASVYGTKQRGTYQYTSGFTVATHRILHNNLNFSRNVIDQDGEAFEPWYPDSRVTEFSHALNLTRNIAEDVQLTFNGYNSLIRFVPESTSFQNVLYAENDNFAFVPLSVYEWNASAFTGGLLENSLGLKTQKELTKSITLRADVHATFDGMLIAGESILRPNWEAQLGFRFHPAKWFTMELNFSKKRVSYNFEDMRYISDDYLNGAVYYWKDLNNDHRYQENEKSDYFASTGGKYRSYAKNVKQPSYFVFDFPLYFRFGKHSEFSILNSFKKYYNTLTTLFDKDATEYGFYEDVADNRIYFLNSGEKKYVVDRYPSSYMSTNSAMNFLTNSPFYAGSTMKYKYETDRFLLSLSWTSYEMAGISSLGNGPLHNNVGVLSETTANPNLNYKLIGRLNQDRAYVLHIQSGWKLNDHLSFTLTGKFKDGQPFSSFDKQLYTDADGNHQIAIWNQRTKGINVFTGDFGSRKDAFFNFDFMTSYKRKIANCNLDLNLMLYNLYDFGTELTEFTFQPDRPSGRTAMSLNIPRGIMITAKLDW